MTYPLSTTVSAGQPTAAAHYNNLRADALRFGHAEADAVTLGDLFAHYSAHLNLKRLGTNRLRVEATPQAPVELVIQGCPCRAIANVDLSSADAPSGSAATWFVFANRSSGASTFTLSVNTSATPTAAQCLVGACYWDGSQIVADSVVLTERERLLRDMRLVPSPVTGGRLTLQSAEPLGTTDRSGSMVYYTPFTSTALSLYAPGFGWVNHELSELSLVLPSTINTNYDLFAYWDGDAIQLTSIAWSSDSARSSALALQDGQHVLAFDHTWRYLGTVRVGAGGTAVDSAEQRFVWNADNQRPRLVYRVDDTEHTYGTSTWRAWNNDSDNRLQIVIGEKSPIALNLYGDQHCAAAGYPIRAAIGVDAAAGTIVLESTSGENLKASVTYCNLLEAGSHTFNLCEYGNPTATCTYYSAVLSGQHWC
ncbi:MAG: hypothetical protein V2J07_04730 [Anaerolineae bacterium]|jgi:hypothetical protein|nr:hypothetical protein [Anaerolineae bacterium]